MFRLPLLTLLVACNGPGPCLDACDSDEDFWDACYDTFTEDYHIGVECWEDMDGLGEALAAVGTDDDARAEVYSDWAADDKAHTCEDADEVIESCIDLVRAEFHALDAEGKQERRDECLTGETDNEELAQAMEDLDCEGFLRAVGLIE